MHLVICRVEVNNINRDDNEYDYTDNINNVIKIIMMIMVKTITAALRHIQITDSTLNE